MRVHSRPFAANFLFFGIPSSFHQMALRTNSPIRSSESEIIVHFCLSSQMISTAPERALVKYQYARSAFS